MITVLIQPIEQLLEELLREFHLFFHALCTVCYRQENLPGNANTSGAVFSPKNRSQGN
jgi:hypothetical protein